MVAAATQTDHLRQFVSQTLVPITVCVTTIQIEDTLGHTTVSKTNYLLFHEPTDILDAALYYQYRTQIVASG